MKLLVERLVEDVRMQPTADLSEALNERQGGIDPEDSVGVVPLVAIDIFDGELGLADAAHASEPGKAAAGRLLILEGIVN
jgi:hypothetical protein